MGNVFCKLFTRESDDDIPVYIYFLWILTAVSAVNYYARIRSFDDLLGPDVFWSLVIYLGTATITSMTQLGFVMYDSWRNPIIIESEINNV
ncbi:hypothetical protein QR680_003658 [Steinernema hermaphroditum]|uniref:Uncharacterized protein n=1 Tax=Steinernema hermaphroditum TaxID=289476 RepID=A0AA39HM43_9BILA|nr:hypothetical protein QR680_003658 [Steinernema hermaphroditum]